MHEYMLNILPVQASGSSANGGYAFYACNAIILIILPIQRSGNIINYWSRLPGILVHHVCLFLNRSVCQWVSVCQKLVATPNRPVYQSFCLFGDQDVSETGGHLLCLHVSIIPTVHGLGLSKTDGHVYCAAISVILSVP